MEVVLNLDARLLRALGGLAELEDRDPEELIEEVLLAVLEGRAPLEEGARRRALSLARHHGLV